MSAAPALTITEIYPSIQGESSFAGQPCTFVRLTACDLRCAWCDTVYAFTEGRKQPLDDIVDSPAVIPGNHPHGGAKRDAEKHRQQPDGERDAATDEQP